MSTQKLRPITDVAADLGLSTDHVLPWGPHRAKLDLAALETPRPRPGPGRLVLVSAVTPTPAGEGKTTTSVGLVQGLRAIGEHACAALREPSLGPCFGIKGGGTGGGRATIEPSTDINLHFTGDFHAITAAHNLLAAAIDNELHFGAAGLDLDPRRIRWPRVLDVNDRALRQVNVGLGGVSGGVPRESTFDITAASEIMALLCMATDEADLRARLDRILIGYTRGRKPVRAGQLGITGALMALLRDATKPNLVQTVEGVPAVVHGGPFANIAHGCNSVLATRMAMHHADWTVTEAGFGFDLGGEKFLDLVCVEAGLAPSLIVLVATIKALKLHGGAKLAELETPDADAVAAGLCNLEAHLDAAERFGLPVVVALNHFAADTDSEVAVVAEACAARGVPFAVSRHFAEGGAGATDLARAVVAAAPEHPPTLQPAYDRSDDAQDKIRKVARRLYGADDVSFTKDAVRALRIAAKLGFGELPVCMAKTPASLSDDPRKRGRPTGFTLTVRDVVVNAGAGFLVVLTGDVVRMPGLPRTPQAVNVDLVDGEIVGVG